MKSTCPRYYLSTILLGVTIGAVVLSGLLCGDELWASRFALTTRLLSIACTSPSSRDTHPLSIRAASELERRTDLFEHVAYYHIELFHPSVISPDSDTVAIVSASRSFFDTVEAEPILGQLFHSTTLTNDVRNILVISEDTWEHDFDRSPSIIGRPFNFTEGRFTIIGVVPRFFLYPSKPPWGWIINEVTIKEMEQGGLWNEQTIVRLKGGVSRQAVTFGLEDDAEILANDDPRLNKNLTFTTSSLWTKSIDSYAIVLASVFVAVLFLGALLVSEISLTFPVANYRKLHGLLTAPHAPPPALPIRSPFPLTPVLLAPVSLGSGYLLYRWFIVEYPSSLAITFATGLLWISVCTLIISLPLGMLLQRQIHAVSRANQFQATLIAEGRSRSLLLFLEIALAMSVLPTTLYATKELYLFAYATSRWSSAQIVVADLGAAPMPPNGRPLLSSKDKEAIRSATIADSVAESTHFPYSGETNMSYLHVIDSGGTISNVFARREYVDENFFSTLKIPVSQLPVFDHSKNVACPVVINHSLELAFLARGVKIDGRLLIAPFKSSELRCQVVGTVNDIQDYSLAPVSPAKAYFLGSENGSSGSVVYFSTRASDLQLAASLHSVLSSRYPGITIRRISSLKELRSKALSSPMAALSILGFLSSLSIAVFGLGIRPEHSSPLSTVKRKAGIQGKRVRNVCCILFGLAATFPLGQELGGIVKQEAKLNIENSVAAWCCAAIVMIIVYSLANKRSDRSTAS